MDSYSAMGGSATRKNLGPIDLTEEDIVQRYDKAAANYDEYIRGRIDEHDNFSKRHVARAVLRILGGNTDAKILDCAGGTGLVAEELHALGFKNLDNVDGSLKMLEIAEKKHVYQRLIHDLVGTNKLDIADDTYDMVLCVGCFSPGHLQPDCFEELIRIIKPDGYLVIWLREVVLYQAKEYVDELEPVMQSHHDRGAWRWLQRDFVPDYLPNVHARVYTFKIGI